MRSPDDYYAILGVLPTAEAVVIRAAYRALSLKYHPDTWSGDKAEATCRMQQLNEAYDVLSDPSKRERYDSGRANTNDDFDFGNETMRSAFKDAETEQETDWSFAVEYYPDLADSLSRLRKVSDKLAFEYRSELLASKDFARRHQVADMLENRFLARYFGKDAKIVLLAKELIKMGHKAGARELNRAVSVLGTADPEKIITRIEEKYLRERNTKPRLATLARYVLETHYVSDAKALLQELGGEVGYRKEGGFLLSTEKVIVQLDGGEHKFENDYEMTQWVITVVAPKYA